MPILWPFNEETHGPSGAAIRSALLGLLGLSGLSRGQA
jgi:hypothetical protein